MESKDQARFAAALIEGERCLEDVERRLASLHQRPRPWQLVTTVISGVLTAGAGAFLIANLISTPNPDGPSRTSVISALIMLVAGTVLAMTGLNQRDALAREKRLLRAVRHLLMGSRE